MEIILLAGLATLVLATVIFIIAFICLLE